MLLLKPNPIEPPWYGPVCPVVWEGRRREVSPYPDRKTSQGCLEDILPSAGASCFLSHQSALL